MIVFSENLINFRSRAAPGAAGLKITNNYQFDNQSKARFLQKKTKKIVTVLMFT